jgi:hypothetical protein
MNRFISLARSGPRYSTLVLLLWACSLPGAWSANVGRVNVMEVDEVRDAATIARAKARKRSEDAEDGAGFGDGAFSSGCSDLNIGNVKTSVGQTVPRNLTIVIEGPVIQENNCR